jgi:hypothetical protein
VFAFAAVQLAAFIFLLSTVEGDFSQRYGSS